MKRICTIVLAAAVFCLLAASPANAQQGTLYVVEEQVAPGYKDFRLSVGVGYAYRFYQLSYMVEYHPINKLKNSK